MTPEQLETVRLSVARAEKIIKTLDVLKTADPYKSSMRVSFTNGNTIDEIMEVGLLKEVVEVGRRKLISDLESELSAMTISSDQSVAVVEAESSRPPQALPREVMEHIGRTTIG